jgi:hypothetical protein
MTEKGPEVQHVVLFSFPRPLLAEEEAGMAAQIRRWPDEIGGFAALRFGTDLTGARTQGYGYLLYTRFPDQDALASYQAHPLHRAFADWVVEREGRVLAFDYLLDDRTVIVS